MTNLKANPCPHKRLELIAKHHCIGEDGKHYKVWRDVFIGFYKCSSCNATGELDSWDMKYNWEDKND